MANIDKLQEWYRLRRRREFVESHDKEDAWNAIQERIASHRRVSIWRRWGSVAAVVLLVGGAVIWWNGNGMDNEEQGKEYASLGRKVSEHKADVSTDDMHHIVSVPMGAEFSENMDDGTKVMLSAGAKLVYATDFNKTQREVQLVGEAYFDVAHNEEKPFVVNTPQGSIEVLGTKFNVDAESDVTIVTLQEGSVRLHFEGREFLMKPGEQALMKKNGAFEIHQVNVSNYTSWSTGAYEFNDVALEEITHRLSLWYDVKIGIVNDDLKQSRYTGVIMRDESLESALGTLMMVSDIKVKYKDSEIEISKK